MIRLVTISRISVEKGFERMLKLESLLEASGLEFIWDCYGDTSTNHARIMVPKFRHVGFKGVTHDPMGIIPQYDYLVQLSSTEGFCYSAYEALSCNVPVIATRFDSVGEMLTDGEDSYLLEMDLSDFNADRIKNIPVIRSFREKSTEKDWINFLNMATKKDQKPAPRARAGQNVKVKVVRKYYDMLMKKEFEAGSEMKVTPERAAVLEQAKVAARI